MQLTQLRGRLASHAIQLELTDSAKEFVARQGYDPVYGARPLKRFLQREVQTALSRKLLQGEIADHSKVSVDCKNGKLEFKTKGLAGC